MLKKILKAFFIVSLIGLIISYFAYKAIWDDNINDHKENYSLIIPTGSSFNDVVSLLSKEDILKSSNSFHFVSNLMNYNKESVPSGIYSFTNTESNRSLIAKLRTGNQTPVNVTFNNLRTLEETIAKISSYLEVDSSTLLKAILNDEILNDTGLKKETLLTLFLPDTYKFNWNSSTSQIISKLKKEHKRFWNSSRIEKAKKLNLSQSEVYTLASIVEKESQLSSERPIIAGLYLNRIRQGIPLQADPTIVFAVGDFSIRRVLNKHLEFDSPYNTYKYQGLPPGPIYLASKESIDAVLDAPDHEYLFMCAKPGYNSEHAFAKTSAEHGRNARRYRSWLNKEGIRK